MMDGEEDEEEKKQGSKKQHMGRHSMADIAHVKATDRIYCT